MSVIVSAKRLSIIHFYGNKLANILPITGILDNSVFEQPFNKRIATKYTIAPTKIAIMQLTGRGKNKRNK